MGRPRANPDDANVLLSKKPSAIAHSSTDFETKLELESSRIHSLQEQYDLLLASHHRLIKLNHELEDRLLSTLETVNSETLRLSKELESATNRLRSCEKELSAVTAERDRLKEDCSTAVSLLQANPDHFVPVISKVNNKAYSSSPDTINGRKPLSLSPAFLPTFPPVGLPSAFHIGSLSYQSGTDWSAANKNSSPNYRDTLEQPLRLCPSE